MNKKILILQFRTGKIQADEQKAYLEKMGVSPEDLTYICMIQPYTLPELETLKGIVISGSGDNSLTKDHPWYPDLATYITRAIEKKLPILGICFGHQFLGRLLGARVVSDPQQKELGTVQIKLMPSAIKEILFKNIDPVFYSTAGHNDSVVDLPDNLEVLATNDTCSIEGFKLRGAHVFGLQFHPELNELDYQTRLTYYKDYYTKNGSDFEELLQRGQRETNDDEILKNFSELINSQA